MKPLVCLQPIPSIPVTATFDQGLGALDVLLDQQLVVKEDAYADKSKNNVNARAEDAGLLKEGLVGSEGFVLFADNHKLAIITSVASREKNSKIFIPYRLFWRRIPLVCPSQPAPQSPQLSPLPLLPPSGTVLIPRHCPLLIAHIVLHPKVT